METEIVLKKRKSKYNNYMSLTIYGDSNRYYFFNYYTDF